MPLLFATPPQDGKAVVIRGLQELAGASPPRAAAPLGSAGLQLMEPYPIYGLKLSDLPAIKGLDSARLIGWRYLLVEGQNIARAAEIVESPVGSGASKLHSVTTAHARATEDIFHKAEALPEVANGDYEIRTLRVPELYVIALWLKDLQHNDDRLLPVPPVFPPFNAQVVYDQNDFVKLLQTAAAKKVRQATRP